MGPLKSHESLWHTKLCTGKIEKFISAFLHFQDKLGEVDKFEENFTTKLQLKTRFFDTILIEHVGEGKKIYYLFLWSNAHKSNAKLFINIHMKFTHRNQFHLDQIKRPFFTKPYTTASGSKKMFCFEAVF